ncbi:hypothetical protein [Dokdonella immobilis]|uniref:Uncharacterized protein n=1 Tax=Dokdonella immobilis TaxID=578942 RepID=A0A1I4ZCJ9_9GAMM|nr:hypothetical protein [Dokdonella immobilis]SFN47927.1 hypothetical protein SAMN05216289_12470 [Dokdonella immobilis]
MQAATRRSTFKALGFVVLALLLAANFKFNFLGIAEPVIFNGWQLNGQARVVGGILADERGIDKQGKRLLPTRCAPA